MEVGQKESFGRVWSMEIINGDWYLCQHAYSSITLHVFSPLSVLYYAPR